MGDVTMTSSVAGSGMQNQPTQQDLTLGGASGTAPGSAGDIATSLAETLNTQVAVQTTILKYNMMSNMQNALHTNKKSMQDKIGNS